MASTSGVEYTRESGLRPVATKVGGNLQLMAGGSMAGYFSTSRVMQLVEEHRRSRKLAVGAIRTIVGGCRC